MPTYQQGDFIQEALWSVLLQDFEDWKMIVVVDGPPDEQTKKHLGGNLDSRISILRLAENTGTANALNRGFEVCSGDFYTWVSSDNVMHTAWLAEMVDFLVTQTSFGGVYSSYMRMHKDRNVLTRHPPRPLIDSENCFVGPAFLYRSELHHEHRGKISHDYDWWLRFEEKAKLGWIDKPLATYRVHPGRVTVTRRHTYDAPQWQAEARKRRSQ